MANLNKTLLVLLALALACGDDSTPVNDAGGSNPDAPGQPDATVQTDGGTGPIGTMIDTADGIITASAAITAVAGTPGASGFATLVVNDGVTILNFDASFMQGMGPGDTQVLLATGDGEIVDQRAADPDSVSDVIGTVTNGATGAQSFVLTGIDASQFSHVIVWCPTATINFGVGALSTTSAELAPVAGTPGAEGGVFVSPAADGTFVISLGAGFMTGMGPGDTQILFAQSADEIVAQREANAANVSSVIGIVPNEFSGDLSFSLPAGFDPSDYSHLVIWCPTATINFGTAAL